MESRGAGLVNELRQEASSYTMYDRDEYFCRPAPPEEDLEIGVGKNVARQTPLYRDAVRRALTK